MVMEIHALAVLWEVDVNDKVVKISLNLGQPHAIGYWVLYFHSNLL